MPTEPYAEPQPGWGRALVPYLGLAVIVVAAYYPALSHAPRADQFIYLYSTKDRTDLYSLTLGSYAWDRDVQQDTHFFRPCLFFLLGLERWLFGPHSPWLWQAASLGLHLAVVGLLFALLRRWSGDLLGFVAAAFFGVQYASMELVAWHHLSGYVLFCVLLVAILGLLARCAEGVTVPRQVALVLLLLMAAFTLEVGNILAVLTAAYLVWVRWTERAEPERRFHWLTALGALAVPALYTAANFADQFARYGGVQAGPAREGCLSPGDGLLGVVSAARLWLEAGFLPSRVDLAPGIRMAVGRVNPFDSAGLLLEVGLAVVALLGFLWLVQGGVRQGTDRRRLRVGVLALCFGLAWVATLVFLRAGPRGLTWALHTNSYYAYLFNLSVLVFLFSLLGPRALTACRPARLALGGALAVLTLLSAWRLHAQAEAQALWGRQTIVLLEQIQSLRQADGRDDFTFCVAADHPGESEPPFVKRTPPGGPPVRASEALFPGHYSRTAPRYVLLKRHRGYDLLEFQGQVYGIPRRGWPADLANLSAEEKARCVVAATSQEVAQEIDRRKGGPR